MKTAYQYIRISNEDQSNFSLSGQEKYNRDYAEKHGIQILKTFIDDGYSAKNFDRPEWRKLEADLSRSREKVDYLIVSKYDRLIRNAADGLAFIEKMEERWMVKLLSVMENFFIDPHSPFFFKMRADMLVNAEFERRVISDRSRFGMWSARSQGRFIGRAPFGYVNARDDQDKPIILVDPMAKPLVEKIFNDFINGVPIPDICKYAKNYGFRKGHDAIKRFLTNPVYVGMVSVRAYKDNIKKDVQGIHQAIIPEHVFWQANEKLNGKIRPQGRIVDEQIPLRGYILCQQCGKAHTGAKSKGRNEYYYYYWCRSCKGEMYNSEKVHKELNLVLSALSLDPNLIRAIRDEALIQMDQSKTERNMLSKKVKSQYDAISDKINSLDEKYFADKISDQTYQKWHSEYKAELNSKTVRLAELMTSDEKSRKLFENEIYHLNDLGSIYNIGNVAGKQALLKGLFPDYLVKEKTGLRTNFIVPEFALNASKIAGILTIKETGNYGFWPQFPVSRGNGRNVEPLLQAISKILYAA